MSVFPIFLSDSSHLWERIDLGLYDDDGDKNVLSGRSLDTPVRALLMNRWLKPV